MCLYTRSPILSLPAQALCPVVRPHHYSSKIEVGRSCSRTHEHRIINYAFMVNVRMYVVVLGF
jgi:hypothetical protein